MGGSGARYIWVNLPCNICWIERVIVVLSRSAVLYRRKYIFCETSIQKNPLLLDKNHTSIQVDVFKKIPKEANVHVREAVSGFGDLIWGLYLEVGIVLCFSEAIKLAR